MNRPLTLELFFLAMFPKVNAPLAFETDTYTTSLTFSVSATQINKTEE